MFIDSDISLSNLAPPIVLLNPILKFVLFEIPDRSNLDSFIVMYSPSDEYPDNASNKIAESSTYLVMGPDNALLTTLYLTDPFTILGILPWVGFIPKTPQNEAGILIEPPPSPPWLIEVIPAATEAADPPEEPPDVFFSFHGL